MRATSVLFVLCVAAVAVAGQAEASTPIVLWHGMGDTCCNPLSMGRIEKLLKKWIPDLYVFSVEIGTNFLEDEAAGFIGNVNKQVAGVCDQLAKNDKLQGGYNALGFSQGGQFLRAVAQRCPNPPMKNLITFGGQHMGVTDIPHCPIGANQTFCDDMAKLLSLGAYVEGVREISVQAQYFRSTVKYQDYVQKNIFLADINNEGPNKNQTYKENLMKLERFVMVQFDADTMVEPRESEQFGSFKIGQLTDIVPMRNQTLYTEDWIGLKAMDQAGKIIFKHCPGDHLQFTDEFLHDEIVVPYLED